MNQEVLSLFCRETSAARHFVIRKCEVVSTKHTGLPKKTPVQLASIAWYGFWFPPEITLNKGAHPK